MRCLPIRSIFRAALLAGLVGSSQYATVAASWTDCLPPRNGSCFIHDLHWERFQQQPIKSEPLVNSVLKVEENESRAADRELELCLAAAKQFDLKQQVEAVQAAIYSNAKQIPNLASNLFASYARSKKMFYSFIENRNIKIVNSVVTPETLPVIAVAPEEERAYDCDWNCGDWCESYSRPVTVSLPSRELANVFIYTVDTSETTTNDAICPDAIAQAKSHQIIDSCAIAYSEYIGDNLLTEAEISQWSSEIAAEISHPWQVGIDPAFSEVQASDVANLASSSVGGHSVCCPVENEVEAVGTKVETVAVQDVVIEDGTIENVTIENVTIENVTVENVTVENVVVENVVVENVASAELAARPPILEAESETYDSSLAAEFLGRRPVHCLISDFDAGSFRSDNDLFGVYDYAHPWLSSINTSRWLSGQGRRFAFGDNSPRMPIVAPPVAAFSKEDLQFANRFSADLLDDSSKQVVEFGAEGVGAEVSSNKTETFRSKDFLTTLQTSAYGSIMLPVNQTQRLAMDYAAKLVSESANQSRVHASKKVASQLRTVGQFLVDFATQIENQVEQVEIARSENKQHENNQR